MWNGESMQNLIYVTYKFVTFLTTYRLAKSVDEKPV